MYSKGNKFSKKAMVSTVITWKGVSQLFFIGGNGIKVNGSSYLKHLHDDLISAVEAMYPNKDFRFVQEKVYDGRYCYPFPTINELKRRIRDVWDECETDLTKIRKVMKQFRPPLEADDLKEGHSIKTVFG